jgi:hypothetical protein
LNCILIWLLSSSLMVFVFGFFYGVKLLYKLMYYKRNVMSAFFGGMKTQ